MCYEKLHWNIAPNRGLHRCAYVQLKSYLTERLDRQDYFLGEIVQIQNRLIAASPTPQVEVISTVGEKSLCLGGASSTSTGTFTIFHADDPCADCKCACHSQWAIATPKSYSALAGIASLRSVGRFFHPQQCDSIECRRPSYAIISATYCMPHWLATRALLLTVVKGPVFSISLSLARIVPADSELFRCIQSGDCVRIQQLFERREASPSDMVNSRYGTLGALLFALNCNRIDVCSLLMSWGADPFAENDTSLTGSPADMAWGMAKEFTPTVPYAAPVDTVFPLPRDLGPRRFSRLHRLVVGLDYGDLDETLIVSPKSVLDTADREGRSATHWAAWMGDAVVLRKLLNAGADPNFADGGGRAPMHFSAMTCTAECTRLLVESGADKCKPDHQNETPLHTACSTGRVENIRYMLSIGAPVDAVDVAMTTPLMSAVLAGGMEAVGLLLDHGVDVEAKDERGETALTLAVWTNTHGILRMLLKVGARVDIVTNSGRTVLHTVAQSGTLPVMEALLERRTLLINPEERDAAGLTALERFRKRTGVSLELTEAFSALWLRCCCTSDTKGKLFQDPPDTKAKMNDAVVEVFEESESESGSDEFEAAVEYI